MFNNLLIRWKLLTGFGIVITLIIVSSIVSVITANALDKDYTYLLEYPNQRLIKIQEAKGVLVDMRRLAVTTVLESGNEALVRNFSGQFVQAYDNAIAAINEYTNLNTNDNRREPATTATQNADAARLVSLLTLYKTQYMEPATTLALADQLYEAKAIIAAGGPTLTEAAEIADTLYSNALVFMNDLSDSLTVNKDNSTYFFIVFSVGIVLLAMVLALLISRTLAVPLRALLAVTNDLVNGNLNINKTKTHKDEIGQLTQNMYNLADIIQQLIQSISTMTQDYEAGDIEALIDVSRFNGSYRTVAEYVNKMARGLVDEVLVFMNCMQSFGNGNFEADIPKLPGKKIVMNQNLDNMRHNLQSIASEINTLVKDASAGRLSSRAKASKYSGGWGELLIGMNTLMEAIAGPINETTEVMRRVSAGHFDRRMNGDYQGEFLTIKNAINETITNIASYISEISTVLMAISEQDDLNQRIDREYVGSFSDIKNALNNILDKLNKVISDIYIASDQVASGARQVSESSMTLAQGATEQASAVEELNATVLTINANTQQNADNAKSAETLSSASKNNAQRGDADMKKMLDSMTAINQSSNNIAKIIKTIDDIAFQTRLLALNAAVEAARAGTHGRGFTVVAEEVRNLAGKSLTASEEIAVLIEESIAKVNDGSQTATLTAEALHTIVDDAARVSDIITNIAGASNQQAEALSQLTNGISQIADVVQSNSATSEESASASQQLSSQAEVLRSLVSTFKLRRNPNH